MRSVPIQTANLFATTSLTIPIGTKYLMSLSISCFPREGGQEKGMGDTGSVNQNVMKQRSSGRSAISISILKAENLFLTLCIC